MAPLSSDLRRMLEARVMTARDEAEHAAAAALDALAVAQAVPFASLDAAQRRLRSGLRARALQLGEGKLAAGMALLVEEVAYVQWHRMLFARFLAENDLLMHPAGVPVTLDECAELARDEGEPDAWQLAARYAGLMLPGIFRPNDPTAQLRFAAEGRSALERIVVELPAPLFTADDALGWVYQFWQKQRKEAVNQSGRKIGGADIAPVTQLFTEPYMVQFLLENSLGAWWAARYPASPLVREMHYLRFRDDGTPAAGSFPGWPQRAAEVTMLDPCCGSGHFLVATFEMLRRMRMEEEGLSEAAAAEATLRDNIHGLELDPRCTQIAAFALAFAAWRAGGYRPLPALKIACSGIPVEGQLTDWLALAGGDDRLQRGLERLYQLFTHAPDLGSLINPADLPENERMFSADYSEVEPLLAQALRGEQRDPAAEVFGAAAEGVAKAARLLAGTYTLVATNVPFLSGSKQGEVLRAFCVAYYGESKSDLATVFVERCRNFMVIGGSYVLVTPHNWRFLTSYTKLRVKLLSDQTWRAVVNLGAQSFQTPMWDFNVGLSIIENFKPSAETMMLLIDTSSHRSIIQKINNMQNSVIVFFNQFLQLKNPDARVSIDNTVTDFPLLQEYADSYWGLGSGDAVRFARQFWEVDALKEDWVFLQVTFSPTKPYSGREQILLWQNGQSEMIKLSEELGNRPTRGYRAWGKQGVVISQMAGLAAALYTGEIFQNGAATIIPKHPEYLPAIWAYCSSSEFAYEVRKIDQKLSVTNATLVKVPFDLARWQKVAEEAGPLPEPYSADPTQWLFNGRPAGAEAPLQVAVARLLGYRWPQQEADGLGEFVDSDGIVCLPAVARELPAEERLRVLLAHAYGAEWDAALQARLLGAVGASELGAWLRDDYFKQHCAMFHNRPFIWHIWDGRKDGFAALLNYHQLDAARLDKLIYTYLGGWIESQRAAVQRGEGGADGRLVAALALQKQLEAIKLGEPPYDIYVRWKPLAAQALGWSPDLNDGVRLNIRPFVLAGVLRAKFTVKWNKDRGTNPDGSERLNDLHYTLAEKRAARGG
ncbi:MAG: hypothetical protein EI684_16945 [Candidatus Viridilinea halotolerans]|uniref:site-specific DNA-methyltransferase (adenine-specific) n=1 Tax=Candidatus Viridilinea halotolerans TaxID=2491704 RepID=A0A426TUH2_9CHLR|nr:MAG: hypothetical protein EI684_16945 [Candidatus Viridilinea halotolerans]